MTQASKIPRSAVFLSFATILFWTSYTAEVRVAVRELAIFEAWLDRERPGYGCDEGPARFRNETVEAAYPGRRFYYVLTYPRGIPPPFRNAMSLVVWVNDDVHPLDISSLETYRAGLKKVTTVEDARRAAAAVLLLTLGDPGQRRFGIEEDLVEVKRDRKGWVCTYAHGDIYHVSEVRFDRKGRLAEIHCNPPPVP